MEKEGRGGAPKVGRRLKRHAEENWFMVEAGAMQRSEMQRRGQEAPSKH